MKFRVIIVDTLGRLIGRAQQSQQQEAIGGVPIVLKYGGRRVRAYIVHATDEYLVVLTEDGRLWKIPLRGRREAEEVISSEAGRRRLLAPAF